MDAEEAITIDETNDMDNFILGAAPTERPNASIFNY
jgi:hypothetical protein